MTMWFDEALATALAQRRSVGRLRRLRPLARLGARITLPDGRTLIDASSNDYLGLSQHPAVVDRGIEWAQRYGAGTRASRLVTGTLDAVLELEDKLARFKGCEAALIFCSGFQANSTVLPALFELAKPAAPVVFADALIHASMHHGCRAAGVLPHRFDHNDLDHLDSLLRTHARTGASFILTESVFSMDGDATDVPALAALAERHGAVVYLDEAHATGVLGPQGRGLAALATAPVQVVMGTLGKALGSAGAYIAGSRALIDYLVNRCAGFIYSTALPPAAYGAVEAALELVPGMEAERARLCAIADRLRAALAAHGIDTQGSTTQIIPALIGDEHAALAAQARLEQAGVLAVAIRPPTVPRGTSRLRFSLSSAMAEQDVQQLCDGAAVIAAAPPIA